MNKKNYVNRFLPFILEIIDFETPSPGTYTITITLKQAIESNVHYAVAWR